ncbi:MAG: hypothetical protein Unbinned838contig1000_54 [Prokaryotic dsDNA virus sp.]|nr:MAG: hypothetical protein Unbinned838contig1000_54 [Prokaryotic dsDNA virus sp.]
MGHMKWISTLNNSDLVSMRQIVKLAEQEDEQRAQFQGSSYEVTYLKNVINYLETRIVNGYLADLEENE